MSELQLTIGFLIFAVWLITLYVSHVHGYRNGVKYGELSSENDCFHRKAETEDGVIKCLICNKTFPNE